MPTDPLGSPRVIECPAPRRRGRARHETRAQRWGDQERSSPARTKSEPDERYRDTSAGKGRRRRGTAGLGDRWELRLERTARPEDRHQDNAAARVAWTQARRDLEARGAWQNLGGHPGSFPPRPIAAHAGPRGLDRAWSSFLSGGLRRDGLARPGAFPPPTPPEREQEIDQGQEQEHRHQEKLSRRPRPHRCPPAATASRGAGTAPPLRAPRSPRAWSCPPGRSSCGSSP
jgi:hypothetical protein